MTLLTCSIWSSSRTPSSVERWGIKQRCQWPVTTQPTETLHYLLLSNLIFIIITITVIIISNSIVLINLTHPITIPLIFLIKIILQVPSIFIIPIFLKITIINTLIMKINDDRCVFLYGHRVFHQITFLLQFNPPWSSFTKQSHTTIGLCKHFTEMKQQNQLILTLLRVTG